MITKVEYDLALEGATRDLQLKLNRSYARIRRLRHGLRFYAKKGIDGGNMASKILITDDSELSHAEMPI